MFIRNQITSLLQISVNCEVISKIMEVADNILEELWLQMG